MEYRSQIRALQHEPEQLEELYARAKLLGEESAFAAAVFALAEESPDNVLLAAWRARLRRQPVSTSGTIGWQWALPTAVLCGLAMYLLAADRWQVLVDGQRHLPLLLVLGGVVGAGFVLAYLCLAGDRAWKRCAALAGVLLAASAYGLLLQPRVGPRVFERQYVALLGAHLVVLGWAAVALYVLWQRRDAENRFAFLTRTLEVALIAGFLGALLGLFTNLTYGLFGAIGMSLTEPVMRLLTAGGAGASVVLAVALGHDPGRESLVAASRAGVERLIGTAARLLVPLTFAVGLIYVLFVARYFRAPFESREVLVVYNGMLLAVTALLIAATPSATHEGSRRPLWLRTGLTLVSGLALLVGLYALVAVTYRAQLDGWTPNRLAVAGWNAVFIGLLARVLVRQARASATDWPAMMRQELAQAPWIFGLWASFVILVTPWAFRGQPTAANLPAAVAEVVAEHPAPILLKCPEREEIYLLEQGHKRWIPDIASFEAQGYRWRDVHFVACGDLDRVPAGAPLPRALDSPPSDSPRLDTNESGRSAWPSPTSRGSSGR